MCIKGLPQEMGAVFSVDRRLHTERKIPLHILS